MLTEKEQMGSLDDAVQVSFCRLYNTGLYRQARALCKEAKEYVTAKWGDSHDLGIVESSLDLAAKFLRLEEKASKEVI